MKGRSSCGAAPGAFSQAGSRVFLVWPIARQPEWLWPFWVGVVRLLSLTIQVHSRFRLGLLLSRVRASLAQLCCVARRAALSAACGP